MADATTTPTTTTAATTTTPALPAALDASSATLEQIVDAVNAIIAYTATLPTSEGSTLTADQVSAVQRLTSFFKI